MIRPPACVACGRVTRAVAWLSARVRKKDLAGDPPISVDFEQHEEIRVARAAPVFGFDARHCSSSRVVDCHDPRCEVSRRAAFVNHIAEVGDRPGDGLSAIASANVGGFKKRIAHARAVASPRGVNITLQPCRDRIMSCTARGFVGSRGCLNHPNHSLNKSLGGANYAARTWSESLPITLEYNLLSQHNALCELKIG
jgi:hypothetical protein